MYHSIIAKRLSIVFLCTILAMTAYAETNVESMVGDTLDVDAQRYRDLSLGYAVVEKDEISSSVVTLSSEVLTDVITNDIGNMLQGKIAGVQISNSTGQPGSVADINIRGMGSIIAKGVPVYVVDGVVGGIFNPDDVETVSVLKDAGSLGIYGASAADGVIVVTTKTGKRNEKPRVILRSTIGSTQPLSGNFNMMDSKELYEYQKKLFSDKGVDASSFEVLRPAALLEDNYNWQNYFFSNGLIQNHYVSVAGGGRKLGYYGSFNYYRQDGTFINTGYEHFSGRVNLDAEITRWLDMRLSTYFNRSNTENEASWHMMNDAYSKMPWDNPCDADGNLVYISSATRPDGGTWYSQDKWNALHNTQYDYSRSNSFSIGADVQLNFHITDWLTLQSANRFLHYSGKHVVYEDPRTFHSEHPDGYLENSGDLSNSFCTTDILKAAYRLGDHSVNGMIGGEYSIWQSENTLAGGVGMPNGVDALNATVPLTVSGNRIPGSSWAVFFQAGYDYGKRYFINATFRVESCSVFAPDHRIGYFPSVSAGWLISNEEFMRGQNIVSFLKLRANYGITGNAGIPYYRYQATRLAISNMNCGYSNMADVGIDLSFINRISMSVDLYQTDNTGLLLNVPLAPSTGFYKDTENSASVRNRGIEYSIDANVINIDKWRWNIGFNIAFNQNRVTSLQNHISYLSVNGGVSQQVKESQDLNSWYMKEWAGVDSENGDPLWYVIDNDGARTTTNNYNLATPTVVGKASPLFFGGLGTQVSWMGLSLSISTNFTYGNKIYNYNRQALDADGAYIGYNQYSIDNNKLGWSRWQNPGEQATHPKAELNGNKMSNMVSSRYLEDGSFFRLKNITLSYDFCSTLIPKKYLTKLRVFVSADNIATATGFSGMDPEIGLYASSYKLAGMCSDQYPVARNIVGGIEIEF